MASDVDRGRRSPMGDRRQGTDERYGRNASRGPNDRRDRQNRSRSNGEMNHHVPLAGPVQYPARVDLPIEPYTLGAWLGDGTTTAAEITSVDEEILEQISGDGYHSAAACRMHRISISIGATGPHTGWERRGRYARNGSLSSQLRDLGLTWGQVHPRMYLEAGVASVSRCCRA